MASIQQPPNNMAASNPNMPGNPNLPGELTPQRLQEVFQVIHLIYNPPCLIELFLINHSLEIQRDATYWRAPR